MRKRYWLTLSLLVLVLLGLWLFFRGPENHLVPEEAVPAEGSGEVNPALPRYKPAPVARESARIVAPEKAPAPSAAQLENAEKIRSSMKISLAALYGAQKSFFSEYGRYSTDFNELGYLPEEDTFTYKTGFLREFSPKDATLTGRQISSFDALVEGSKRKNFSEAMAAARLEDAARYCQWDCTASESHFEILSVANLDDDPDLDVWVINDKKVITQAHDDLAD